MTTNPDDAREIADDLRSVVSAAEAAAKGRALPDLLREAATALDALAAERDRLAAEVERLQKALRPFASPMMDRVQTDVRTAHQLRGNGASEAMHDDDCDLRVALRKAVGVARAALAGEGR